MASHRLEIDLFGDLAKGFQVALHARRGFSRRGHARDHCQVQQALLHFRLGELARQGLLDLVDDLVRRALGRGQAEPGDRGEPRQASFGRGGHVGQGRHAFRVGDEQGPHLAGLDEGRLHAGVVEHRVDVAAQQIVHGRTAALVGHDVDLHAGGAGEHELGQMLLRAQASVAEGDLVGILAAVVDEFLQVLGREFIVRPLALPLSIY